MHVPEKAKVEEKDPGMHEPKDDKQGPCAFIPHKCKCFLISIMHACSQSLIHPCMHA